ncbi:MAG: tRNA dihydrouridine(20/20a) synthase DusA [Thioalkalivibrionaceae bacterium]
MMDWTDSTCRRFHRLLTREALLYTEMLHANAVIHGERSRLLAFDAAEQPLAVQLGGSDPTALAAAARICEDAGFDEINLNVGCPSERVQSGAFGACLMAEPERVAEGVAAMRAAVAVPVTVKHRIGIDDQDAEEDLERFTTTVAAAGCDAFIVHARKAWLQGLDPKANREVPPLDYARVQRLKARHPGWRVVLNGGLTDVEAARSWLDPVSAGSGWYGEPVTAPALDGVMLGRAAYQRPLQLARVDRCYFARDVGCGAGCGAAERIDDDALLEDLVEPLADLAARVVAGGQRLHSLTRHVQGLGHARPGGRLYRRLLTQRAPAIRTPAAAADLMREALQSMLVNRPERGADEDRASALEGYGR